MIAEEYLGRSRLFRRLKSGPHRQLVELYAERLVRNELAGHGTGQCLNLVGGLLSWIKRCGLTLTDLDERVAERHLKQCVQRSDRAALKRLLSVLREAGMIASAPLLPITSEDQIFEGFSDYLRRERGRAEVHHSAPASHPPFPAPGVPCWRQRPRQGQPRGRHPLHRAARMGQERRIPEGDVLVAARIISPIPPS